MQLAKLYENFCVWLGIGGWAYIGLRENCHPLRGPFILAGRKIDIKDESKK